MHSSSATSSSTDPRDKKRKSSDEEEAFLQIKAQKEAILKVPKASRTSEQVKEHNTLGKKFRRMKPKFEHLLQAKKSLREVAFITWSLLIKMTSGGQKKRIAPPLSAPKKCFAPPLKPPKKPCAPPLAMVNRPLTLLYTMP